MSGRLRLRSVVLLGSAVLVLVSLPAAAAGPCASGEGVERVWPIPTVVGVPRYDDRAGAVDVREADGEARLVTRASAGLGPSTSRDEFGAAVALADVNSDSCIDLVVGAPGQAGVGAVHVLLGTTSGAGTGAVLTLPYRGAQGDRFGVAVAVEGRHIWVGAPGRDVAGHADAGAVVHFSLSAPSVTSGPAVLTQDSAGVPGAAESGDRFGEVLAPSGVRVVVGVPREDIGDRVDAGMVVAVPAPGVTGPAARAFAVTQDTAGIPGRAQRGDHFGAAVDTNRGLWVGVPDEDHAGLPDAGLVHLLSAETSSVTNRQSITQNTVGVRGRAEAGDRFGAAVTGVRWYWDCPDGQAAIGVPGEDLGRVQDAGAVTLYSTDNDDCNTIAARGADVAAGERAGTTVGRVPPSARHSSTSETVLAGIPLDDIDGRADAGSLATATFTELVGPRTLSTGARTGARYGAVIAEIDPTIGLLTEE